MAERKTRSLLECQARVTLISPLLCVGLRRLSDENKIETIWREYRKGDLAGAFLVVVSTDSDEVNDAVVAEAEEVGALINVVDRPDKGNLLVPAVARRGNLVVAISTGGRCPALAKKLRVQLESSFVPEYAQVLDLVSRVRDQSKRNGEPIDASGWQDLLNSEIIDLVRRGLVEQAEERLTLALAARRVGSPKEPPDAEGGR